MTTGHETMADAELRLHLIIKDLRVQSGSAKGMMVCSSEVRAQIVQAILAAGFGPVREAQEAAWDQGYDKGTDLAAWAIGNRPQSERPDTTNPYREAGNDDQ